MFKIDTRSLFFFRWSIGICLFVDGIHKLFLINCFYSDAGVMPRVNWINDFMGPTKWSFHLGSGSPIYQFVLMVFGLAAVVLYTCGIRPRVFGVVSFIMLSSMQSRNYLILTCADELVRMALFWSLFLPLEITKSELLRPKQLTSIASFGALSQLLLMYLVTALFKFHPIWVSEFSAVYYALHIDFFAAPIGVWLRQYLGLTKFLTISTLIWEFAGPILALFYGRFEIVRILAVFAFMGFHVGLGLSLKLGMFPWVCISFWVLFLPAKFWDFEYMKKFIQWLLSEPTKFLIPDVYGARKNRLGWDKCSNYLAGVSIVLVFSYNIDAVFSKSELIPAPVRNLTSALNLHQVWDMFAPYPIKNDGWFVIEGTYSNGKVINVRSGGAVTYDKPESVVQTFSNTEWRKFLLNAWNMGNEKILVPYGKFICRENKDFEGHKEIYLEQVKFSFMKETTPPMGESFKPPELVHLLTYNCSLDKSL